jgi:phasin family protein
MSQKPKAGAQSQPAAAAKAAPKEAAMKAAPAKAEPVAKSEPVEAEPAKVELPATAEPVVKAAPAAPAEPPFRPEPVVEEEPVAKIAAEAAVSAPEPVKETIAAASDLAAASAKVVATTVTATADTVAAVTTEAVEIAASSKPTRPAVTPNVTQGIKTMMKSTEDFVAFGQANLEAFVKSGQIWSAGVQELTKQIATSAKASFDESVSTFKAISTAKSVKEAMELQSTFAKAALEKAMAESNKLTDASIKLTEQTLAPITARVTSAVETFGKTA